MTHISLSVTYTALSVMHIFSGAYISVRDTQPCQWHTYLHLRHTSLSVTHISVGDTHTPLNGHRPPPTVWCSSLLVTYTQTHTHLQQWFSTADLHQSHTNTHYIHSLPPLSLTHTCINTRKLFLSLSLSHTHTHTLSLSLLHTCTYMLSLCFTH